MHIESELTQIWSDNRFRNLPNQILARGFVYAENESQRDILITGINPSFREGDTFFSYSFNFQDTISNPKYDNYWDPIKKMLWDVKEEIDLRNDCAYLDILYFREKEQAFLKKHLLKTKEGLQFVIEQIKLTQQLVEYIIKPKVIVI